jgi:hypothetical protein
MSNFVIFIVGLIVTLITAMGVITSTVFVAYKKAEPIKTSGEINTHPLVDRKG